MGVGGHISNYNILIRICGKQEALSNDVIKRRPRRPRPRHALSDARQHYSVYRVQNMCRPPHTRVVAAVKARPRPLHKTELVSYPVALFVNGRRGRPRPLRVRRLAVTSF
ncbi:hypothetical protein EVAR_68099_1 [Eumeta japonica]|uniref:Uncharacterized protein n=1 Tax=Eumeta variegata TaxID=151549 RepID=A0A4C2AAL0_EUMVA|nr:hypothetical protein EVAR_68099_1 [Eumeta japonica]